MIFGHLTMYRLPLHIELPPDYIHLHPQSIAGQQIQIPPDSNFRHPQLGRQPLDIGLPDLLQPPRQSRLPTWVNGNDSGMLIETCAGLLDKDNPEAAIRRETEEETGYKIDKVKKVFEAYMSPGSVTE